MTELLEINLNAQVKNGPTIAFGSSIELDAYDKLEVTIADGSGSTLQLVPAATSAVQCLFVQSSEYSTGLTYQVNGAGTAIALDRPQSFIGVGAVSALDSAAPPSTLVFDNASGTDVNIQILVGRTAVA